MDIGQVSHLRWVGAPGLGGCWLLCILWCVCGGNVLGATTAPASLLSRLCHGFHYCTPKLVGLPLKSLCISTTLEIFPHFILCAGWWWPRGSVPHWRGDLEIPMVCSSRWGSHHSCSSRSWVGRQVERMKCASCTDYYKVSVIVADPVLMAQSRLSATNCLILVASN